MIVVRNVECSRSLGLWCSGLNVGEVMEVGNGEVMEVGLVRMRVRAS